MPNTEIASPALTDAPIVPLSSEAVAALATTGGFFEMHGLWQSLLRSRVFPQYDLSTDRKLENTYRKRLATEKAMSLLMLIWKDSGHVSDAEIDAAEVQRIGSRCAPINCHNLARKLSADIEDYDRQEKAIQGIVKAAVAYGLVELENFNNTRQRALRGTARLHALMLAFADRVRPICAEIAASGPGGQ